MAQHYWQGKQVTLRAMKSSDLALFQSFGDEVSRYIDAISLPHSDLRLASWFEQQQKTRFDDSFRWVADNSSGQAVGTIETFACNRRHGTFKYSVVVAEEHRHKGYAVEMIMKVLQYYFMEMGYQKVTPHVYAFNRASIGLHERMGFRLEGRLRNMIYMNGSHHDELHYGMTREEFETMYGRGES